MKTFQNFAQMQIKLNQQIKGLRSDYGSELQSQKIDKWLINQEIIFKPLVSYSQEENRVSKRTSRTIMEMVQATILKRGMEDTLYPEVVLAITYVKNLRPTQALEKSISPIKK